MVVPIRHADGGSRKDLKKIKEKREKGDLGVSFDRFTFKFCQCFFLRLHKLIPAQLVNFEKDARKLLY